MYTKPLHWVLGWGRALAILILAFLAACGDITGELPDAPAVAAVEVTPGSRTLSTGEVLRLVATARGADGASIPNAAVEWATSNDVVAGVDVAGNVVGRAAGTAVITARSGGRTGQATITVEGAVASVQILPASPIVVNAGGTLQLTTVVRDSAGNVLAGRTVEWLSSDTSVARVGATGVAEGRMPGQIVVSARVEGKTAQSSLRVTSLVARVDVAAPSPMVAIGEVMQLVAEVRGHEGVLLNRGVTWVSDNPEVATVNATGRVTGRAPGVAQIRATSDGVSGSAQVVVSSTLLRALVGVGDEPLPATLFRSTWTDSSGVAHGVHWEARSGAFRLITATGQFELRLWVWMEVEGYPSALASRGFRGDYSYDTATGELILQPATGAPLRGRALPDGSLVVTGSVEPGTPPVTLKFAIPQDH